MEIKINDCVQTLFAVQYTVLQQKDMLMCACEAIIGAAWIHGTFLKNDGFFTVVTQMSTHGPGTYRV